MTTAATAATSAATAAVTWDIALTNGATAARDAIMSSAAVALRGADAAAGGGLTLRGGNGSAGSGGGVAVAGGSSSGANAGSSVTLSPGAIVSGARGRVLLTHSGPNTDRVAEVSSTGTNGAACQVFASATTPGGVITANVGDLCLFDDGTRGDFFVKDNGNATATGWRGVPTVYTASGVVQRPKRWVGSATTDASGNFSADISSAGFTTVTSVSGCVVRNTATVTDKSFFTVTSVSTTAVVGTAVDGRVLAALGATIENSGSGLTVYVTVDGV